MRRVRAASLLLVCLAGCAADLTAGREDEISNGTRETGYPAVVMVLDQSAGGLCTGTIIAPRVVLTAKHCVQRPGAAAPQPPTAMLVGIGDSTRSITTRLRVQEIRTTPGVYNDRNGLSGALVGIDVAVLILQSGVSNITPIPVRRDRPTDQVGRDVTFVGFGETPAGEVGVKYRTTATVTDLGNNVINSADSICQGDSGGPMLQADGQLIGVASYGSGGCGNTYNGHNVVYPFLELIDLAIRDTGLCVNDGMERCDGFDNDCNGSIDEVCIALGRGCQRDDECYGGKCRDTAAGRLCAEGCDPLRPALGCQDGFYCARTPGTNDGACIEGRAGTGALGASCTRDTDCAGLACIDLGLGKTCVEPCRGDAAQCLASEVCVAGPDQLGACAPIDLVQGARGLGEACATTEECGSGNCFDDLGNRYCTRACAADLDCSTGFHCRDSSVCVRGRREGVGGGCATNADCSGGALCATSGTRRWCTVFCSEGMCPTGFTCAEVQPMTNFCVPSLALPGEVCTEDAGCSTGLCRAWGNERRCTRSCGRDAPCSTGLVCGRQADGTFCVPPGAPPGMPTPTPTPTPPRSGGCSTAGAAGTSGAWALVGLAFGLAIARRRRVRA